MTQTVTRGARTAAPTSTTPPVPHQAARAIDRARFWLYRNLIALKEWRSFRTAEIIPLAAPVDGPVRFRRFAEAHPGMPLRGLYEAMTFPAEDRAAPRLRGIRFGRRALDVEAAVPRDHPTTTMQPLSRSTPRSAGTESSAA